MSTSDANVMRALFASPRYGDCYITTHPEETKPEIPYQRGAILAARSHIPPEPPCGTQTYPSDEAAHDIKNTHPLELCFKYPPAAGKQGNQRLQLKITDQIRVKDPANSQVVLVEPTVVAADEGSPSADFGRPGGLVAAKFHDPLYYDYDENKFDPFITTDSAYRHEVKAYHHMQPLYGKVVPRFYGSFTVDIPLPEGSPAPTRPVRAVLYEYIPGTLLYSPKALEYCTRQRQAIMAAVLNVNSKMYQLDVIMSDFHPRNMIVCSAEEGKDADVRFIDFGDATVGYRARKGEAHSPTLDPQPREQLVQQWQDEDLRDRMLDFAYLIDWPWNDWLRNEYPGPR